MIEIVPNVHPVFVHFSIALLTAAALFLVVVVLARGRSWASGIETAANWNLWAGAAISIGTVMAGLQAEGSVTHDDLAHAAMQEHKFWAFGTLSLFLALALWNAWRVRRGRPAGAIFVIGMLVGLVALGGTGLRGADLVFRHGLGVMSLPDAAVAGHAHDDAHDHAHDHAHDGEEEHSRGVDEGHAHDGDDGHSHD